MSLNNGYVNNHRVILKEAVAWTVLNHPYTLYRQAHSESMRT